MGCTPIVPVFDQAQSDAAAATINALSGIDVWVGAETVVAVGANNPDGHRDGTIGAWVIPIQAGCDRDIISVTATAPFTYNGTFDWSKESATIIVTDNLASITAWGTATVLSGYTNPWPDSVSALDLSVPTSVAATVSGSWSGGSTPPPALYVVAGVITGNNDSSNYIQLGAPSICITYSPTSACYTPDVVPPVKDCRSFCISPSEYYLPSVVA